tara:strand:+ start:1192 stop:2421 length:1230 start_codon:yes stop_codon:yes gene_type:complete
MSYNNYVDDASISNIKTYCNNIDKSNKNCGCMKNILYGDYCGKHKSRYLTNSKNIIISKRFTKQKKDYNKKELITTISYILSKDTYKGIELLHQYSNNNKLYAPKITGDLDEISSLKSLIIHIKRQKFTRDELFIFVLKIFDIINKYDKTIYYNDKINHIVKSQSYIRRFLIMNDNYYKGPAYFDKSKSCNGEDFFSFTPLCEIEKDFFFSYRDINKNIWSYDIRSLKKLIEMKQGNPYNRDKIPRRVKIKIFRRLAQLKRMNICVSLDQPIEEDINLYIKHRCIDIIQHVNQFGYYVEEKWIMSLNLVKLKSLYANLEDIWNYRAQLTPQGKRNICPPNGIVFNKNVNQINNINNITDLKKIILDELHKLIFSGINESDQKLGAMYFLIGLSKVEPACLNAIPWLQYV